MKNMAIKKKKLMTMDIKINSKEPVHTIVSFTMVVMGIIIMLYFGIRHIFDEPDWSKSAFLQFALGFIGLLGSQLFAQQPIIPQNKHDFKPVDLNTGIRAIVIGFLGMGIQLISKQAFSFTILEQAVYFVFAAITEEVFFRGFILSIFIKLDQTKMKFSPPKLVGVLVQAIGFAAIHQNYYDNLPMLISVFVGGLMLGFVYLIWEDLTANILGHFIINVIAVQNLLVYLGSYIEAIPITLLITILIAIALSVIAINLTKESKNLEEIQNTQRKQRKPKKWQKWILFGSLLIFLVIFSYYFGDMIEPWGV